jgi:hypothetical protein
MKGQHIRHRIKRAVLFVVAGSSLASVCFSTLGETIGSPLIHRQFADIDHGQVYIYNGSSNPFHSPGRVSTWAFFDDRNVGLSVTPLVFKVTGKDAFTLIGIGATRVSAGTGLQNFSFDLIAGSRDVSPGQYTFGFANRPYAIRGTALVPGTPNTGVIAIDRPSATIPNDPWIVTAEVSSGGAVALNIGTIIGAGGIPIYNPMDPGGLDRVYSAQATVLPTASPGTLVQSRPGGIVGWWPGDGHAADIVNGNNGTLTEGATFAPGKVGLAFSLNGSGATVEIPDSSALNPSNVTVEAWVNFASMDTRFALAPGAQYIVFKRNSRYDRFEGYALLKIRDDHGVDRLCFGVTSAEGNQVGALSSTAVVIGKWYHVAGTYDGAVARLFVNGTMEDSHRAGFPLNYGTRPLFIGSSGERFWPGNLNGLVDEVSLYNRALSPAEIAGNYEAGSGGKAKPEGWNAWSITDFVMCENAKMEAPHDWHIPKAVFRTGDSKVFAWAELTNVSGVHSVEMKLWRPDGIYYGKETQVTHEPLGTSNWWRMSARWGIKGNQCPSVVFLLRSLLFKIRPAVSYPCPSAIRG